MPAPDHLLPILDRLGDGGTVPMAEVVHGMIEEARGVPGRQPPAELQAQFDVASQSIADLGTALLNEFGGLGPLKFPDWEREGPCGVAVRILREQRATIAALRPAGEDHQAQHETYTDPDGQNRPPALDEWDRAHGLAEHNPPPRSEDGSLPEPDPDATQEHTIDWDDDPDSAAGDAPAETAPATCAAASAADIRAWAREAGVDVPAKGFIPKTVREQYDAAHPEA